MSDLLEQLDTDSLLLMYATGELSPGDRAAVQVRLASDPQLAARAEEIRAAHDAAFAGLGRLDGIDALPVSESAAVRNVAQSMRQWQARRAVVPPDAATGQRRRFFVSRWSIGVVAAASVAAVALVLVPWHQTKVNTPLVAHGSTQDGLHSFERQALESLASAGKMDNTAATDTVVLDTFGTDSSAAVFDNSSGPLDSPVFNVEDPGTGQSQ